MTDRALSVVQKQPAGEIVAEKCLRWIRTHPKLSTCLGLLTAAFVTLNCLAFMHAHAMTHFTHGVSRTDRPENLTVFQRAKVLLTGVRIPKPLNLDSPDGQGMPFMTHRYVGPTGIEYETWHIPRSDSRGLATNLLDYIRGSICPRVALEEAVRRGEIQWMIRVADDR